jgi:hypothetical protein
MRLRASLKHLHCHLAHLPPCYALTDLDEIIAIDLLDAEDATRAQGGGSPPPGRGIVTRRA